MRLSLYCIAALLCLAALAPGVQAQERIELGLLAGTGVMRGAGQGVSVAQRAPLYIDLSYRAWNEEQPDLILGGALRAEVEGAGAVGGLPRVELRQRMGPVELRPGAAFVFLVVPKTLLGPEGSLTVHLDVPGRIGIYGTFAVTAYILGSDLPKRSSVLAMTGGAGVSLPF